MPYIDYTDSYDLKIKIESLWTIAIADRLTTEDLQNFETYIHSFLEDFKSRDYSSD